MEKMKRPNYVEVWEDILFVERTLRQTRPEKAIGLHSKLLVIISNYLRAVVINDGNAFHKGISYPYVFDHLSSCVLRAVYLCNELCARNILAFQIVSLVGSSVTSALGIMGTITSSRATKILSLNSIENALYAIASFRTCVVTVGSTSIMQILSSWFSSEYCYVKCAKWSSLPFMHVESIRCLSAEKEDKFFEMFSTGLFNVCFTDQKGKRSTVSGIYSKLLPFSMMALEDRQVLNIVFRILWGQDLLVWSKVNISMEQILNINIFFEWCVESSGLDYFSLLSRIWCFPGTWHH